MSDFFPNLTIEFEGLKSEPYRAIEVFLVSPEGVIKLTVKSLEEGERLIAGVMKKGIPGSYHGNKIFSAWVEERLSYTMKIRKSFSDAA
jgi:hypothetical protein